MADIKPMLDELKSKIPSKEKVLQMIDDLDLTLDTKKLREKSENVQSQILTFAKVTAENPKIKDYALSVLSSDVTNKAIIKLKEVLPNQDLLDKIDSARLKYINQEAKTEEVPTEKKDPEGLKIVASDQDQNVKEAAKNAATAAKATSES